MKTDLSKNRYKRTELGFQALKRDHITMIHLKDIWKVEEFMDEDI